MRSFLKSIFSDYDAEQELPIITRQTDKGYWENLPWDADVGPDAWYFGVCTVKPPERRRRRISRKREDLVAAWAVVLDDVKSKVDPRNIKVEPSWRIETSPGNEQWGYLLDPVEDLDHYERCINGLARAGLTDPGARGAYRVMRVPGSLNLKHDPPHEALLLEGVHTDRVWDIDDLMEQLGAVPCGSPRREREVAQLTEEQLAADPVLAWLKEQGWVYGEQNTRGWLSIHCPWEHEHTTGEDGDGSTGYAPMDPVTEERAFSCLHSHEHSTEAFLRKVAALGGPDVLMQLRADTPDKPGWVLEGERIDAMPSGEPMERVAQIAAKYVYSHEDDRVVRVDTDDTTLYKAEKLGARWTERIETITPGGNPTVRAAGDVARGRIRAVDRLDFRPDKPEMLWLEGRKWLANSYRAPYHVQAEADTSAWDRLMERVAAIPEERAYLERWLAYKLQRPWARGPLVLSVSASQGGGGQNQGSGRGTLQKLLRALLGHRHVQTVPFEHFAGTTSQSQYTDFLDGTLLLCVDEAKDSSAEHLYRRSAKVSTYERLKELADPGTTRKTIIRKGLPNTERSVFTSLIVSTNHMDALEVPREDRRVFACRSAPSADSAFWAALHADIENPDVVAAIYWRLMSMDVSDFDPHAPAPMTPTKEALCEATMDDREDVIEEFIEQLPGELITPKALKQQWTEYAIRNPLAEDIGWGYVSLRLKQRKDRLVPDKRDWCMKVDGMNLKPYVLAPAARREEAVARWRRAVELGDLELIREEVRKNGL